MSQLANIEVQTINPKRNNSWNNRLRKTNR